MEKSLTKRKLFGIKKTVSWTTPISAANTDVAVTQHSNRIIEKATLEAERKKAEAITILRRYIFR